MTGLQVRKSQLQIVPHMPQVLAEQQSFSARVLQLPRILRNDGSQGSSECIGYGLDSH